MVSSLWLWQLVGFSVTSLGGTLLHFLYDLTGGAAWTVPFSGVNESTWEHMKLLFWPMLIFALIQSAAYRGRGDFWCIKLRGILLGIALIPLIFYIYNGAVGKSADWFNISIFFIAAAAAYIYEARLFKRDEPICTYQRPAIVLLCIIALSFVVFSYVQPRINLFMDPTTGEFGA